VDGLYIILDAAHNRWSGVYRTLPFANKALYQAGIMSLRKKQTEFAGRVPHLIQKAFQLGYEVTLGDAYRDPRCPYGSKSSRHKSRLAIDLNLFKDGVYLRKTSDHKELGEYWESLGGIWGGRFNDGNHYEWPL